MDSSGKLNGESLSRALKGIEIFYETQAKFIVTCGWDYRPDCSKTIAEAFCEFIKSHSKIGQDSILLEKMSRDTVGDAYFTKVNIAEPRNWGKIIVITSDYHLSRTQEIFDFIYGVKYSIKVIGIKTTDPQKRIKIEENSLEAFRLTFVKIKKGDTKKIGTRLCTKHPFYNGEVFEKIKI